MLLASDKTHSRHLVGHVPDNEPALLNTASSLCNSMANSLLLGIGTSGGTSHTPYDLGRPAPTGWGE